MIDQYPPANGVLTSLIWRKTAAGGETSLSGYDNASQVLSYTPGQEQVYLNGILLVRGSDYTATNGTSITGLAALAADDFVQINCYNNFSVATLPTSGLVGEISNSQITSLATSKLTGTISNAQLAGSISNDKLTNSSITINGSPISLGGSVSLPGDIESVTASSPLTGGGTSGAVTIGIQSASTSQSGAVQLTDSTSSTSTTTAATPNAVKSAYDLADGAIQKTLTTTTGDIIYASSANTPARLGIGSTNQVLTVSGGIPSWATPSGGGGSMTLESTTAFSGNTVTVTLPSSSLGYKQLILHLDNWSMGGGNGYHTCRFNNDSGANYRITGSNAYTHAPDTVYGDAAATKISFPYLSNMNQGYFGSAWMEIHNPYTSTGHKLINVIQTGTEGMNPPANMISGYVVAYTGGALTTISFANDSGGKSYTAGTLYVYGVK